MEQPNKLGRFSERAFVHPEQPFGDFLVKRQAELKDIEAAIFLIIDSHPELKYERPTFESKFNVGMLRKLYESGALSKEETEQIRKLIAKFTAIVKKQYAVQVKVGLTGVELSAEGRPMVEKNVCVNAITEAVKIASDSNMMVVSRNVVGQLNDEQQNELFSVSGAHALSEFSHVRPKISNPFGEFPQNKVDLPRSRVFGGFVYWSFKLRQEMEWDLRETSNPFGQQFYVDAELASEFGLEGGSYELNEGRLDYLGKGKMGFTVANKSELMWRVKPGPYDRLGKHVKYDKKRIVEEHVSPKYDGEFAQFTIKGGTVCVRTRAGRVYEGKSNLPSMRGAIEFNLGKKWGRILYIRTFMANNIPLNPDVQQSLAENIGLEKVCFGGTEVDMKGGDPKVDGVVLHVDNQQQWFIKNRVTCDLTWSQLRGVEDLGFQIDERTKKYYVGVKEYEIKDKTLIFLRRRMDKYIGNDMERIKDSLTTPTVEEIKAEHGQFCTCNLCSF